MIKWSILQEDITILNIYVPNNRVSKYVRQKLIELQGEIDGFTIIFGEFNIPLSVMDRYSRQKISKNVVELNGTIYQLTLIDIYKIFHQITDKYTFSSRLHEHSPRWMRF